MKSKNDKKNTFTRRDFLKSTSTAAAAATLGSTSALAKINAAGVVDTVITSAAIHPAIGVARVGNSSAEDGFFIGPEVLQPPKTLENETRDPLGALKRQAARFRIFGYNAAGQVVRELTGSEAQITWSVHLANKKAAWYRFIVAMDLPEAQEMQVIRRNADIKGDARRTLVIDPGPVEIKSTDKIKTKRPFPKQKIFGAEVSLGELRTDDFGRLLVLGGLGQSGSLPNKLVYDENELDSFNNANGWYDDTSDGPVNATVIFEGREIIAKGAWVVVAPPNYAPDVLGWRTLYDLLVDTFIDAKMMAEPQRTSFQSDILPILQRLSELQWVNKGFADTYGRNSPLDFSDPAVLRRLAQLDDEVVTHASGVDTPAARRQKIYQLFRNPEVDAEDRNQWPFLYGDAYGTFEKSPRNCFAVSGTMQRHLKRWAEGNFISDYSESAATESLPLDKVDPALQPAILDRAALQFCLADAFHPGCEVTWPMRHASLYSEPFRIRRRAVDQPEADLGPLLSAKVALDKTVQEQGPGDLTKWMAVPWQGDTVFCRSGYEPDFDPYLLTFWPARVPNHVLAQEDYEIVINQQLKREVRLAAFKNRVHWVRHWHGRPADQILQMVSGISRIGVIEARSGIRNDPDFPAVMFVETLPADMKSPTAGPLGQGTRGVPASKGPVDPVQQAGWENLEQLEAFRRAKKRR